MGHMLERLENGEYSFAFTGSRQHIWHRHGVEVPADISAEDMKVKAGLDWSVELDPVYRNVNGVLVPTDHSALIRSTDGRQFDVVPDTWVPTQNGEAFEFFEEFVKASDLEMSTAGSIKGGQHIFVVARIKNAVELLGEDLIQPWMLFSLPHVYGQRISLRSVLERAVCYNTLSMALGETAPREYTQSHRSKFNPEKAKEILGVVDEKLQAYKEQAEFLASKQAKNEDIVTYFKRIFPVYQVDKTKEPTKEISKNAKIAQAVLPAQPGAKLGEGTWWQVFNTVTYMQDHVLGKNENLRFEKATFGTGASLKRQALNLAMEMAEAS